MKKIQTIIALLILSVITVLGQPQTGDFEITYTEAGTGIQRSFACYVPENYDSTQAYPLLHVWHGNGVPATSWRALIKTANGPIGAIIVCPDYNGMTTANQLNELGSRSYYYPKDNYNIDTTKMIIMGHSDGGYYAFSFGLYMPNLFNGIIGINPFIDTTYMDSYMWSGIHSIRMATILGTLDEKYNDVKLLMNRIQNQGGELLLTEKPGVTHSDNTYFNSQEFRDDIYTSYLYVTNQQTKVNEISVAQNIKLYPNPATDYFFIENMNEKNVSFSILNVMGQIVNTGRLENNTSKINTTGLTSGIYFIKINFKDKTETIKIIKR